MLVAPVRRNAETIARNPVNSVLGACVGSGLQSDQRLQLDDLVKAFEDDEIVVALIGSTVRRQWSKSWSLGC